MRLGRRLLGLNGLPTLDGTHTADRIRFLRLSLGSVYSLRPGLVGALGRLGPLCGLVNGLELRFRGFVGRGIGHFSGNLLRFLDSVDGRFMRLGRRLLGLNGLPTLDGTHAANGLGFFGRFLGLGEFLGLGDVLGWRLFDVLGKLLRLGGRLRQLVGLYLSLVVDGGLGVFVLGLPRDLGGSHHAGRRRCDPGQLLDEFFDGSFFLRRDFRLGDLARLSLERRRILPTLRRDHDVHHRADEHECRP